MRAFRAKTHPRVHITMEPAEGGELDVESLCQEYVGGQSTLEAPKLLARGTLQLIIEDQIATSDWATSMSYCLFRLSCSACIARGGPS